MSAAKFTEGRAPWVWIGDFAAHVPSFDDARLIAAAPELLHELELQADTLADLAKTLRLLGKDMLAKACEIAEGSARATIAKALGSAS